MFAPISCITQCEGLPIQYERRSAEIEQEAMLIGELLSKTRRIAAIKQAQDAFNARLASDPSFARSESGRPRHAKLGAWIDLSHGRRVLELGCGPGRYAGMLGSLGFDVVGVDPSHFDTWDIVKRAGKIEFRSGTRAEHLPFADESFDHICCLGALLYFEDPEAALSEMRRVLKRGGRVVLRTVNKRNRYTLRTGLKLDPSSKNLYSLDELHSLVERFGFRVNSSFQFGYYASVFPDLYWYWVNVRMSADQEERLSDRLQSDMRVNNVVHLTRV